MEIYRAILRVKPAFPFSVNETPKDLIKKLLIKNPDMRLAADGNFDTLFNHSFFSSINF